MIFLMPISNFAMLVLVNVVLLVFVLIVGLVCFEVISSILFSVRFCGLKIAENLPFMVMEILQCSPLV